MLDCTGNLCPLFWTWVLPQPNHLKNNSPKKHVRLISKTKLLTPVPFFHLSLGEPLKALQASGPISAHLPEPDECFQPCTVGCVVLLRLKASLHKGLQQLVPRSPTRPPSIQDFLRDLLFLSVTAHPIQESPSLWTRHRVYNHLTIFGGPEICLNQNARTKNPKTKILPKIIYFNNIVNIYI